MENIFKNNLESGDLKLEKSLVETLEKSGNINPEKTLETTDGAKWLELISAEGERVEGKLFVSTEKNENSLVLVIPGMMGDINATIEEKWKEEILKDADLFVLRHNGISTRAEESKKAVHCDEMAVSRWEFTGDRDEPYSPNDLVKEPETALSVLGENYDKIKLVSHSFGGFQTAHALSTGKISEEIIKKIDRWVSLSGWTSDDAKSGLNFDFETVYGAWLEHARSEKIFHVVPDNRQFFDEVDQLFAEIKNIPPQIEVVVVSPEKDEAIGIKSGEDLFAKSGKSLLILDKTAGLEGDVHSNDHNEVLPRLLSMTIHGKHRAETTK